MKKLILYTSILFITGCPVAHVSDTKYLNINNKDINKIDDVINFIKKVRDLGLDFCDKDVSIQLKLKDTPDHEITNRMELIFVDGNRETSMKVTHNIKDRPKEEE